ncbi:hypothetical protein [Aeromicrobium sp. Root236]|uniref:hypothetical protein n=1 Tax=Aeromicrobium sp. Root236 TaxID=1736498 RepID=UPI00138F05F9|nr:hypothetical protein [Aeromicrobium sp. Root236]
MGFVAVGVFSVLLATHAWDHSEAGAFVAWSTVATVSVAIAVLALLPGPWLPRVLGVGLVVVIVATLIAWAGVISPRRDVSKAYDGDNVGWSRLVPKDQRTGEDRDQVSVMTALSDKRVVVTRDKHVLVVDPRNGRTIKAFTSSASSTYGLAVARTVDGFVIQDSQRLAFYDADGDPLGVVHGDALVARAPGTSVVVDDCETGECSAVAFNDAGDELWRSKGYGRPETVRIADDMPAWPVDQLAVVPTAVVLTQEDDGVPMGDPRPFDVLAADTGKRVRSFTATYAGSALTRTGQSRVFAVQPDAENPGDCTVLVWDATEAVRSDSKECETPVGVTGGHLVFSGVSSSRIIDLFEPRESSAISPAAKDATERPPTLTDTGVGGTAVLRMRFSGPTTTWSSKVVTGGAWEVGFSKWWTYATRGDVTGAWVGEASVLVSSKVVRLNPWDEPSEDDREMTVVDIATGKRIGRLRVDARVDSSVGLPDGSWLVALEGGRLLRVGGSGSGG